jgi:hypothetical protein
MKIGNIEIESIQPFIERTNAKLRFATAIFKELKNIRYTDNNDLLRAMEEAFLFHLMGTIDAYLFEIVVNNNFDIKEKQVTINFIYNKFNRRLPEDFNILYSKMKTKTDWLCKASYLRNNCAHRFYNPRSLYIGGEYDNQIHLIDPSTNNPITKDFIDLFSEWLNKMNLFILELREKSSAL